MYKLLVAIETAAMKMLGGEEGLKNCRKPEIMADAAYCIVTRDSKSVTGNFFVDDEVLKEAGVTNFDSYASAPGKASVFGCCIRF
jgi:citronellol/citronellal dehydrogenase